MRRKLNADIEELLASLDGLRVPVLEEIRRICESKNHEGFSPLTGLASGNERYKIIRIMRDYGITGNIPPQYKPPSGRSRRKECLDLMRLMEFSERIMSRTIDREGILHVNSCSYCRYNIVIGIYAIETIR